jgi:hypothetical protein
MNRRFAAFYSGVVLAAAGSTPSWGAEPPAESAVRWTLKGSRIIACCCASPCSCRINKPPMHCHGCDYTTAVRIERGSIGKTRMDGVTYAFVGRAFSQDPETNWVYVYVSDTASDEQVRALTGVLQAGTKALGKRAPYIAGKFVGMRKAPLTYTVSAGGREHVARIPSILELTTRAIVLPGRKQPVISTGIFDDYGDRFVHAEAIAHTYRDPKVGREWDLTGRQANQADFLLTSERVAKGGIGWGCWSAHATLGTKDKYQEELVGHK